ncbi:ABC transporter permease [Shimazuella alba]|uniref:FtsX-like permease family protein n=1 Tax=Shimazuella alba TaxID=2690964 RepID=A0A6I4VUF2_9BACL|nr:FtsX-like permease family protein [Shimazuella alba]MXQ53510.1 FtsX-like permease family protein [Shimazuella alba]
MYILKNAFRNVLRNGGRNLLIGAIILAVIVTSVIALMISNTASGIIDDYKSRFGSQVQLKPNMDKVRKEAQEKSTNGLMRIATPTIPSDQYIAFGESDYLQKSEYTASTGVNNDKITAIAADKGGGSGMMMAGNIGGSSGNKPTQFMMSLRGNQFTDFTEGTRKLAQGKMPSKKNEAIVSTDLAEANKIRIGDKLSLQGEVKNSEKGTTAATSYEVTVVGTYYDATEEYAEGAMENAYTNRRNEILTTYETVIQQLKPNMDGGIRINATYYLKEPGMLDAFAKELYAKGLDEKFDVATDEESYNKIVGPVEGLKGISVTFMIVVLIFGGIIIVLLSSMAIRERKYEIGVLRAMGMKKWKVALGLWSEMLIITSLCLVFGLGIGSAAAQPITDTLLAQQIESAELEAEEQAQQNSGGMMMGPISMSNSASSAEPLRNLDISLGSDTALQIIGIALLLASIAGLISISRITKYEPIKILMERN